MMPFASQRGGGQDLATHLMNAQDNEQIELFQMRGAVARDLHGAFKEWEAIAHALTRARQYLCSLSINPDELQGRLTREQYLDYIERAEERLGLSGQPRAIVFHVKDGREHCHVIWSRTDVAAGRAIPLSFFKEKLMTVTREFARDHGLELPAGYRRHEDGLRRRNRQLSAYDGVKQQETGISHEERMAAVTDAWRRSDSAKAFVAALEDLGYMLARGRNKTRVVLVDYYGHTTALTRLIDDPAVRARQVSDFLGTAYAPDDLPSVEEAQEQAAQRRELIEAFEQARLESEQSADLVRRQAARRADIEAKAEALRQRQHDERMENAAEQNAERRSLKAAYMNAQRRIRLERERRRPRGLAAFLGRVSGVTLIIRKIQRHRDRRRYRAYLIVRDAIKRRQQHEREVLAARHGLQRVEIQRRMRALGQIEQRERESVAQAARGHRRRRINGRHIHLPPLGLAPRPTRQKDAPAGRQHDSALARDMAAAAEFLKHGRPQIRLADAFARVSGDQDGGEDSGESGGRDQTAKRKRPKRPRRRKRLRREFDRAVSGDQDEGESGGSHSEGPKPPADPEPPPHPRRKKRPPRDAKAPEQPGSPAPDEQKTEEDEAREKKRRQRRRDLGPGM